MKNVYLLCNTALVFSLDMCLPLFHSCMYCMSPNIGVVLLCLYPRPRPPSFISSSSSMYRSTCIVTQTEVKALKILKYPALT